MASIDPLSTVPLHIQLLDEEDTHIANATGFVVSASEEPYLITNWHVITGRNPVTGALSLSAVPSKMRIWHHSVDGLGTWHSRDEPLHREGSARWLEHPSGSDVDVVALPLANLNRTDLFPMDLSLTDSDLRVMPSELLSVIGFPFGHAAGGKLPIWKTGHVASDVEIDYDGRPVFLIDATTRSGMSGSPVVARRTGSYTTEEGVTSLGGSVTRFMGVYSSRIVFSDTSNPNDAVEIGMVWKPRVIHEILS